MRNVNEERLAKIKEEKRRKDNNLTAVKNSRLLYWYRKGKNKIMRRDLVMSRREELLEKMGAIGAEITVKRQYSIGYQNVGMEIKIDAGEYDTASEFIELELMKQVDDLPLDKIKEIDNEAKGSKSNGGKDYSKNHMNQRKIYPKNHMVVEKQKISINQKVHKALINNGRLF